MVAINVLFGAELFLLSMMLSRSYQMRSCNRLPYSFRQIVNDIAHEQSQRSSTAHFSTQKVTRNGLGKPKGYWDVKSRYVLEQQNLSGLPDVSKPFLVLGIESSCDDTGAAIVRSDGVILSNVVYSQYEIHEKFGGIVPSLAMEAHKGNIEKAVSEAIKLAGLESCAEVDVIAVTRGPGLEICLRVGYQKAQALAHTFKKPFVTVHHLEAHCVMARLAGKEIVAETTVNSSAENEQSGFGGNDSLNGDDAIVSRKDLEEDISEGEVEGAVISCKKTINDVDQVGDKLGEALEAEAAGKVGIETPLNGESSIDITVEAEKQIRSDAENIFESKVEYPFLAFLASGGHTSILLCKKLGEYEVLGGTLDDALGEALDKAARLLGLRSASSGGAAVEASALNGDKESYPMTVPMRTKLNCDFSYAGLKNAFRLAVQTARAKEGLDVNSTNAPASQMEEAPETVTLSDAATSDLCASFQAVAFQHVEDRLKHALNYVDDHQLAVTSLVVVGGVAANKELRRRLLELLATRASSADARHQLILSKKGLEPDNFKTIPLKLYFPPPALCTDNGVMVAWAGIEKIKLGISDSIDGQEVIARWPLGSPIQDGQATFRKGGLKN